MPQNQVMGQGDPASRSFYLQTCIFDLPASLAGTHYSLLFSFFKKPNKQGFQSTNVTFPNNAFYVTQDTNFRMGQVSLQLQAHLATTTPYGLQLIHPTLKSNLATIHCCIFFLNLGEKALNLVILHTLLLDTQAIGEQTKYINQSKG